MKKPPTLSNINLCEELEDINVFSPVREDNSYCLLYDFYGTVHEIRVHKSLDKNNIAKDIENDLGLKRALFVFPEAFESDSVIKVYVEDVCEICNSEDYFNSVMKGCLECFKKYVKRYPHMSSRIRADVMILNYVIEQRNWDFLQYLLFDFEMLFPNRFINDLIYTNSKKAYELIIKAPRGPYYSKITYYSELGANNLLFLITLHENDMLDVESALKNCHTDDCLTFLTSF